MAERTDYQPNDKTEGRAREKPSSMTEAVKGAAQERFEEMADQALEYAGAAQDTVQQVKPMVEQSLKERPMATLAGAVMVGFVLGALWKK